jgi:ATP-dependent RNA helicase DOB1
VCAITELYEGSIIRATRRLDELLTQLTDAAKEVGDGALAAKFQEAQASIRRDIVFAASLYI